RRGRRVGGRLGAGAPAPDAQPEPRRPLLRRRVDALAGRLDAGGRAPAAAGARGPGGRRPRLPVSPDGLAARVAERALLRGEFILRSGKRSTVYLDKYRFETDPLLLRPIAEALAALAREHGGDPELLAGPELGAVPLVTALALELELPFVIVRHDA